MAPALGQPLPAAAPGTRRTALAGTRGAHFAKIALCKLWLDRETLFYPAYPHDLAPTLGMVAKALRQTDVKDLRKLVTKSGFLTAARHLGQQAKAQLDAIMKGKALLRYPTPVLLGFIAYIQSQWERFKNVENLATRLPLIYSAIVTNFAIGLEGQSEESKENKAHGAAFQLAQLAVVDVTGRAEGLTVKAIEGSRKS